MHEVVIPARSKRYVPFCIWNVYIKGTVRLLYLTIKVGLEIVLKSCVYLRTAYLNLWTDFCVEIVINLSHRFFFRYSKLPSQYANITFKVMKFSKQRNSMNRMQNI